MLLFGAIAALAVVRVWADDSPAAAPETVASSPAPDRSTVSLDGHPVGPEDLLEISVFEIPELTRTVRVSERGTISLPLLGELRVSGLTSVQLEDRLRGELSKKYIKNPQVSVFVRQQGSRKVSVLGAVGKPGVYEMLGPRTLMQVLSEAGGLTKDVGGDLYVIRGVPASPGSPGAENAAADGKGDPAVTKIAININDLMTNRDPALDIPIEPGDIVSVPIDRPLYIYVDGAVKTPGRIEQVSSRPITLLQAIAKAGGATERANLKKIQVVRQGGTGPDSIKIFNVTRIRHGKDPDPVLSEGDVVVVPETFF